MHQKKELSITHDRFVGKGKKMNMKELSQRKGVFKASENQVLFFLETFCCPEGNIESHS